MDAGADRYQGLKRWCPGRRRRLHPEQQVRIFHAPALDLATTEHKLGNERTAVERGELGGRLKRVQPNFSTTGLTERLDLHPEIALSAELWRWQVRPSVGVRETPTAGAGRPRDGDAAGGERRGAEPRGCGGAGGSAASGARADVRLGDGGEAVRYDA